MATLRFCFAGTALIVACVLAGCSTMPLVPNWLSFSAAGFDRPDLRWESHWERALAESEVSGRPILLCLTGSDWCKYCIRLENEVFRTRAFEEWSRERVVLMLADFPRSAGLQPETQAQNARLRDQFAEQFSGYPTVVFVDSTQQVLGSLGYMAGGPENWIAAADEILGRPE